MTIIKGRYGAVTCHISPFAEDQYLLELTEHGGYCRFGTDNEGLTFVDPSGGPFIAREALLSGYHRDLPELAIKEIFPRKKGGFILQL
jgi:hypothetical protein